MTRQGKQEDTGSDRTDKGKESQRNDRYHCGRSFLFGFFRKRITVGGAMRTDGLHLMRARNASSGKSVLYDFRQGSGAKVCVLMLEGTNACQL